MKTSEQQYSVRTIVKNSFQDNDIRDRLKGLIHYYVAETNKFSNYL